MVRFEATIISSAIRIISLAFFIFQLGVNLLNIPNLAFLVIVPIVTSLLIAMAGWGFAVVIDLLAGIEASLRNRSAPPRKQTEDWSYYPTSKTNSDKS